jgi:hypothetical protein
LKLHRSKTADPKVATEGRKPVTSQADVKEHEDLLVAVREHKIVGVMQVISSINLDLNTDVPPILSDGGDDAKGVSKQHFQIVSRDGVQLDDSETLRKAAEQLVDAGEGEVLLEIRVVTDIREARLKTSVEKPKQAIGKASLSASGARTGVLLIKALPQAIGAVGFLVGAAGLLDPTLDILGISADIAVIALTVGFAVYDLYHHWNEDIASLAKKRDELKQSSGAMTRFEYCALDATLLVEHAMHIAFRHLRDHNHKKHAHVEMPSASTA